MSFERNSWIDPYSNHGRATSPHINLGTQSKINPIKGPSSKKRPPTHLAPPAYERQGYKVVAHRAPKKGEFFVGLAEGVMQAKRDMLDPRSILEKVDGK